MENETDDEFWWYEWQLDWLIDWSYVIHPLYIHSCIKPFMFKRIFAVSLKEKAAESPVSPWDSKPWTQLGVSAKRNTCLKATRKHAYQIISLRNKQLAIKRGSERKFNFCSLSKKKNNPKIHHLNYLHYSNELSSINRHIIINLSSI